MGLLYKIADDKQNNRYQIPSYVAPAAAGIGALVLGRKIIPHLVRPKADKEFDDLIGQTKQKIDNLENADHKQMVDDLYKDVNKKYHDLVPKSIHITDRDERERISKEIRRLDRMRDELAEASKSPESAKKYIMDQHEFDLRNTLESLEEGKEQNIADKKYKTQKILNRINGVASLGAAYGTHKYQENRNAQMKKTASDKDSDNATRDSFIRSAVGRGLVNYIPGGSNIAGFSYGLKEGHPVVGLLGGMPAVEGARKKDGEKGTLIPVMGGGALAGGAIGYMKPDKLKDKMRKAALKLNDISEKVNGEPIPSKDWEQIDKIINGVESKHSAAEGALGGALLSGGAYALGRIFGDKKDKNK